MEGGNELEAMAKLEAEPPFEGPTMMGRKARQLMLSGQGDQALVAFKVDLVAYSSRCARYISHLNQVNM